MAAIPVCGTALWVMLRYSPVEKDSREEGVKWQSRRLYDVSTCIMYMYGALCQQGNYALTFIIIKRRNKMVPFSKKCLICEFISTRHLLVAVALRKCLVLFHWNTVKRMTPGPACQV